MVNGVPREVPRPKPEGPQAPRVLAAGLSEGLHFTMIHPRLFHRFSFFWHPELEYEISFGQWTPGSPLDKIPGMDSKYC